ncbi:hypothetical protein ABZ385_32130, partial [Streptomyces sp. NPDC005898]
MCPEPAGPGQAADDLPWRDAGVRQGSCPGGALTFCLVATLVVAVTALATGALLFPLGEVTTI